MCVNDLKHYKSGLCMGFRRERVMQKQKKKRRVECRKESGLDGGSRLAAREI
jgi:hypothetical protein